MTIWTQQAATLLKPPMGESWSASGSSSIFYGIFDQENRLDTDTSGQTVIIAGSVVTVLTSDATSFAFGTKLVRAVDNKIWTVGEKLKVDDGILSRLTVTEG